MLIAIFLLRIPQPLSAQDASVSSEEEESAIETDGGAQESSTDASVANSDQTPSPVATPEASLVAPELPIAEPRSSQSEPQPAALEVTVRGTRSEAQRLQESAEAVNVVDTKKARQQTADLGEVLARTQGVGVRRDGGLGSNGTIFLNGLQGDQIRLFFDGVPLNMAGYPFGLVNIPVNLVERVEVYRGVVPIRFGADALGGAINVVGDPKYETHVGASYQTGSFGTHRATVNGRYRHEPTGLVVGAVAFIDSAKNNFEMSDRALPTPEGGTIVRSVNRFHDAYRAYGVNAEMGVVDQRWAKRLLLQGFLTTYDKELQTNAIMTTPYGEVTYGETIYGGTARYEVDLARKWSLELVANYAHRDIYFRDVGQWLYSWTGERTRMLASPGEFLTGAIDRSNYENTLFGRALLSYTPVEHHILRASLSPQAVFRSGKNHIAGGSPVLDNQVSQFVGGVEYEANLFDDRLSNIAFGKSYWLDATAQDQRGLTGSIFEYHRDIQRFGGGDALRYRFSPWLLAKASYEYATRLPRADELFGDGMLIESSANDWNKKLLRPEVSHNVNVGPRLELKRTSLGDFMLDVNGFMRDSKDMIVLLPGRQFIPYANIAFVRTLGFESATSWVSKGRWMSLEGSLTWQDQRNTAKSGPFEHFNGMRMPSRPYFFASWGARVRVGKLPKQEDALEPFYYGRFVESFPRGWDIGDAQYKLPPIPRQVSHALGVTYLFSHDAGKLGCTLEASNITDARLYDVYGVQRPGRAFYLKVTGQL